jgi:hypothetical protein
MVTVGYGDIGPVSTLEVIVLIFSMLIICGVFAYSINEVGQIMN